MSWKASEPLVSISSLRAFYRSGLLMRPYLNLSEEEPFFLHSLARKGYLVFSSCFPSISMPVSSGMRLNLPWQSFLEEVWLGEQIFQNTNRKYEGIWTDDLCSDRTPEASAKELISSPLSSCCLPPTPAASVPLREAGLVSPVLPMQEGSPTKYSSTFMNIRRSCRLKSSSL